MQENEARMEKDIEFQEQIAKDALRALETVGVQHEQEKRALQREISMKSDERVSKLAKELDGLRKENLDLRY
jgi:hypothetical protein